MGIECTTVKRYFLRLFQNILLMMCDTKLVKKDFHFFFYLLSLQIKTQSHAIIVGLLILPSATANLLIIPETFNLTRPRVEKLIFQTYSRY